MYSFLLKEKEKDQTERGKGKGKENETEEETQMETAHRQRQCTTMRALSLPTRRHSAMNFPEFRREAFLQDFLLLDPQTRDQLVGRLFAVHVEPIVLRAVREGLQPLLNYFNLPQRLLPEQNIQARYQLHFTNSVKDTIFTDDQVTDKKGDPIGAAIYDSCTRSIVPPDCFLSSAKVRITVLDAEFWKNKPERFTTDEFTKSILKERDGKGAILTGGGLTFQLKNGRGSFGSLVFKDNSSWTKNGFCLGVTFVEGQANGEKVQEGVSEPFRVKDRRGKASQKPDLLKLKDKVQSLKNIGKDRASLLEIENIKTVEDFLLRYYADQQKLRLILGIKSESDKGWKTMVAHVMECDDEFKAKYNVRDIANQPQQVSVGEQVNITNANMDQLNVDCPVGSNINSVSPLEEALRGTTFRQNQNCFSSEAIHMLGQNVQMLLNPGLRYVGSGSSEPTPREHNLIGFAEPEIHNELIPTGVSFSNAEITPYDFEHASPLQQVSDQTLARNISLTNGTTLTVNLGLPQPNPFENDINDQGDMSAIYGHLAQILDLSPVNDMTIESGNTMNVDYMHNMDGDGFFPIELSTKLIQIEQELSVCVAVSPSSPYRKAKRKALLKWIISPAIARKRARAAPPV